MSAVHVPIGVAARTCLRCSRRLNAFCAVDRNFSSSARRWRSHGLPVFLESSSAELDDLLISMRDKIFLPGYLSPAQKKLVRQRKHASHLENDLTFASIGDEEIRLFHIDPIREVPPTWQSVNRALELATTGEDWVNMLGVLEGLHHADLQRGVRKGWREKFVRKAAQNGRLGVVMQALQQVERNGFSLKEQGIRFQVFKAIYGHAQQNEWSKAALNESVRWALGALEQLEHPAHCGSRIVVEGDGRTDPFAIGVTLDLLARRQQLQPQSPDGLAEVEKYMLRLVEVLRQSKTELDVDEVWITPHFDYLGKGTSPSATKIRPKLQSYALNGQATKWLPVYRSLQLSLELLQSRLPQESVTAAETLMQRIYQRLNSTLQSFEEVRKEHAEALKKLKPCGALEEWKRFVQERTG